MPPTLYGDLTVTPLQQLDGLGPSKGEPVTVTRPLSTFLLSISSLASGWAPLIGVFLCLALKENRKCRILALLVCAGVVGALIGGFRVAVSPLDCSSLVLRLGWALAVAYTFILLLVSRLGLLCPRKRVAAVVTVFVLSGAIGWLALHNEYESEWEQDYYPWIYLHGVASLVLAVLAARWMARKKSAPKHFRLRFLVMIVLIPMVLASHAPYVIPAFYEDGLGALVVPIGIGIVTAGVLLGLLLPFLQLLRVNQFYRERVYDLLGLDYPRSAMTD